MDEDLSGGDLSAGEVVWSVAGFGGERVWEYGIYILSLSCFLGLGVNVGFAGRKRRGKNNLKK